jgi:hypothetical protein
VFCIGRFDGRLKSPVLQVSGAPTVFSLESDKGEDVKKLTLLGALAAAALVLAAPATPAPGLSAHGQFVTAVNANQSSNWFGYNLGTVERGGTLFNSISGDWTVPTARQHTKNEAEYSSDWIGIGGGCVDAGCTAGDTTLIQTGTEQDVDATGKATYGAWWEIIPGPSVSITMTVAPGDRMHADISEAVADSNVWTITLIDVTRHETFTQTVPYSSTHATAEWIEETPLVIDTSGSGLAVLPKLTKVPFTNATVNGASAKLVPSEEIQLIDANGKVIGAPSAPTKKGTAFAVCAWASSC